MNDDNLNKEVLDGEVIEPEVIQSTQYRYENYNASSNYIMSNRNGNIAVLLCWFGGVLGLHRFYLGRVISGVMFLITGGFFGIGVFSDLISISFGGLRDNEGKFLKISSFFKIISGLWVLFLILSFVFSLFTGTLSIIFSMIAVFFGFILG